MHSQKLEVIRDSLETARAWEAKGADAWRNIAWSNMCISSALMNFLSIAVEEFSSHSNAAAWLLNNDTLSLLRRTREHLDRLIGEVDAGRIPSSTYGGNYPHLVYAHLSWALQDYAMGESFVDIAERKDIAEISTPFWSEYARGMGSLTRNEPYEVRKTKLRGQEEYWACYLHLIEAASNRRDLGEPITKVNQAFARRNADKKIKDDNYETEGSGGHPVKWDYRRDSLLTYITHKQGP